MESVSLQLRTNLAALVHEHRSFVEAILGAPEGYPVQEVDGVLGYRVHRDCLPFALGEAEVAEAVAAVPEDAEAVLLFGWGEGELLEALRRERPGTRLVAWDRDPRMIRRLLEREDLALDFASGLITPAVAVDLEEHRELPVAWHPFFRQIYREEARLLESSREERPRAMVRVGSLFCDDLGDALRDRGYEVWPLDLEAWSPLEARRAFEALTPAALFCVNMVNGLPEFAEMNGIPLIIWEIDPSTDRILAPEGSTDTTRIFSWRRENVEEWRRVGYAAVEHLVLAANPERRCPLDLDVEEQERYRSRVCFVGSSMAEEGRRARELFLDLYLSWCGGFGAHRFMAEGWIDEIMQEQLASEGRYIVPELLRSRFEGFIESARLQGTRGDPLALIGEEAASRHRFATMEALAPFGVNIWGDAGWEALRAPGARYRGSAGHLHELTRIYNAAEIQVDVGRIYQRDIVTMRVFDALAAGAFVIAEESDDLAACLRPGVEVETWKTREELAQKVEHYLAHPDRRYAIADAGRKRVLADHSIARRLDHMLATLDQPTAIEAATAP